LEPETYQVTVLPAGSIFTWDTLKAGDEAFQIEGVHGSISLAERTYLTPEGPSRLRVNVATRQGMQYCARVVRPESQHRLRCSNAVPGLLTHRELRAGEVALWLGAVPEDAPDAESPAGIAIGEE
jgi:hypothetical protein